jgi:hypothetical protein
MRQKKDLATPLPNLSWKSSTYCFDGYAWILLGKGFFHFYEGRLDLRQSRGGHAIVK